MVAAVGVWRVRGAAANCGTMVFSRSVAGPGRGSQHQHDTGLRTPTPSVEDTATATTATALDSHCTGQCQEAAEWRGRAMQACGHGVCGAGVCGDTEALVAVSSQWRHDVTLSLAATQHDWIASQYQYSANQC